MKEIAVGFDINTRFKQEQSDDNAQRKRRNVVLGGFLPFIKLDFASLCLQRGEEAATRVLGAGSQPPRLWLHL